MFALYHGKNGPTDEEWADESNFYEDNNMDYTTILDAESREELIKDLYEQSWFCNLFEQGEELGTIVYKGHDALRSIKEVWYMSMQNELENLKKRNGCDTYCLRKEVNNPFAYGTLFCLPGWNDQQTSYPRELMELLDTLEDGTVLYINSVLDYHW